MAVNIKDANMGEIVEILRKYSPVSVKEIAAISGLSIPCVTKYLTGMLQKHLLIETIDSGTAAGRKPKLYAIDPACRNLVVIDLGSNPAKIGIADLSGRLLFYDTVWFIQEDNPKTCIENVITFVKSSIEKCGVSLDSIGCFVIGNPGVVDPESGTMRLNADFAIWYELPVRQLFMEAFKKPVLVFNDVNLSAIGEKNDGVGKGCENFIYIRDDVGLKAGIVINNTLFEGEHHAAGEIGLNYFAERSLTGHPFSSVRRVETEVSVTSLLSRIRNGAKENPDDVVNILSNNAPDEITLDLVEKALNTENTFAAPMIERYADALALSLANLTLTLDIGLIVLGGEITKLGEYLLRPLRQSLSRLLDHPPAVFLSELGNKACVYGAILTGREFIFQNFAGLDKTVDG